MPTWCRRSVLFLLERFLTVVSGRPLFARKMFLAEHIGQGLGRGIDRQRRKRHLRDFFEHPRDVRRAGC